METKSNARDWQTRTRLGAALVIGSFQILYLTYYAAGLVSGDAMEAVLGFLTPVLVLYPLYTAALVTHMALGLYKLYRRHTLVMPPWEAAQIVLGLSLPFVLIPTNMAFFATGMVFHLDLNYVDTLLLSYPDMAWRSVLMMLIVGAHAQIGVHAVLRMRPWYPRFRVALAIGLTFLPLAAAWGYVSGSSHFLQESLAGGLPPEDQPHPLSADQRQYLAQTDLGIALTFAALYVLLFAARALRLRLLEKQRTVRVEYPSGGAVMVLPTTTVLEASRIGGIAHASICGGRGRCTTCRVKVELGMENLSPVGDREQKALARIGAGPDIRLACQAEGRTGTIRVTPLLPADVKSASARLENRDTVGRDVELTVLFADLRGFTALSERKFPYDVVYILNSYFQAMGKAIDACRAMALDLQDVNRRLAHVLPEGLNLGIGLHFGDVVLGEVGFQDRKQLTIIGDTVNTASRLESLNKRASSQLILSTKVAALAGLDLSHLPVGSVTPRGKAEALRVYVVKDIVSDLTAQ